MKFRITATKKTINQLKQKGNIASLMGDSKTIKRTQVILMIIDGISFKRIAFFVGITEEAIRQWLRDFLMKGIGFLKHKKSPGRPSKLTKGQKRALAKIIENDPGKFGFMGGCWRTPMVQQIIEKEFGITYSCLYISRLLANMGFSFQKATFVAVQRDEALRKVWLEKIWPQILKEARKRDSYILFGDECSFSQYGTLTYTWARIGVQPVLKTSSSKRSYKVFGLIEYFSGKFFSMAHEGKINSDSYQTFLEKVLSMTKKHVILIQDNARYHTSEEMDDFFAEKSHRISVYQLPAFSPDLNPIEKLWKKMKTKGTHLKFFPNFDSLVNKVEELMVDFTNSKNEILSLFGFYEKLELLEAFKASA